ncbi:putative cytochrome c oxidase subunit VIa [Ascodesmis nigricans]|uniref:Cytochrome c oxidase subunit n=1 Tax=Ascodesmis nigricans TaxID=341454 RepID=A0A4S2MV45_9PEZI|nr:putative cytochrome c oxidase subunit VIa [Ascodesmis nigricans]
MFAARLAPRAIARPQLIARRFNSTVPFAKPNPEKGNKFIAERLAVEHHAASSSELWRKLSIYGTIPFLVVAAINAYNLYQEHMEHWDHMEPLEERTEYDYQNIRTKNFFWGDGDKTLFWNPKYNYHKTD